VRFLQSHDSDRQFCSRSTMEIRAWVRPVMEGKDRLMI
jgi:hypothetical protein